MVHIIPLSVAQRRRDADASPVSGAAQQLDGYWQEVAVRHEQRQAQQQAFDTEIAARRLSGEIARAEAEAVAGASADGAGLHEAVYGAVDPHTGQAVKAGQFDTLFDSFLDQSPADLRPGLAERREALRAAGSARTAMQQLQRRKDYERAQVDTALQTNAIAIGKANPGDHVTFEAARQDGLDLIDKMGVDPGIRQQLVKDWFSTAAKVRFEALIAKDPKRALAIFGVGMPAAGSETAGDSAQGRFLSDGPTMAGGKEGRVGTQTPDERIAQAFRDDLPQQEQEALALKAKVAKFSQDIETRVAIGRAEADAPDEIARTGAYSGAMPGKDAYRIIYGLDEGDRRRQVFEWRADVGKKIFDMRTMSNQAINAAVVNAEPGPDASPADQANQETTAVAAKLVFEKRQVASGDYVSGLSPKIAGGWEAVFGNEPSNPGSYDPDLYDQTIALSVAQQKALGIEDENLQPIPFSNLLKLAEQRDSGSVDFMDNYAKASELFARTKDPVARAALVRELDDAGLGGILPGGKPGLSAGEVFRADAKALGKKIANVGIGVANANDWVAYGMSGGTISPPDYKGAYYEPSNNTEKVMMRQIDDALGWAIPMPGVGRAVESAIPRAIERIGAVAAERAENTIATKHLARPEVTDTLVPEAASGQTPVETSGSGKAAPVQPTAEKGSADMALTPMDVPAKQKRPFGWDYPAIPDYDLETGLLFVDTAGDRLAARLTAGRRKYKGADKGLNFDQFRSLANSMGVSEIETKTPAELREIAKDPEAFPVGGIGINPETGNLRIVLRGDLSDRGKLVTISPMR
ncbi:hypothetical protein [Mesorhizobium neociceri]|uniref:Uncharacterized protein n=1 Tax=Mesorhizobium neociceri TaxID=1307853 RepID=A0A838B9P6_9HYPH|nr:hypothetical protein [Mesorhizobium neociceri]MBA1143175.1 hypothetical protein [Mesorhizobium neociceri]